MKRLHLKHELFIAKQLICRNCSHEDIFVYAFLFFVDTDVRTANINNIFVCKLCQLEAIINGNGSSYVIGHCELSKPFYAPDVWTTEWPE